MKYAHTPIESMPSVSLPPRSDIISKSDVTKTASSLASVGRKDVSGDGDESEEERERRLHELQDQVSRQRHDCRHCSPGLAVPHTMTSYGDRSFAVQGPHSWNSLPAELRTSDVGLDMFRRKLKTFLFNV